MRSKNNRALAKLNKSLITISGILADDVELRKLIFYPASNNYDDSLELVSKKEVMKRCTSLDANYPDYIEEIGAFIVIGVPEFHTNKGNNKYVDVVLSIDILVPENSTNYEEGLRVLEIADIIDYLLNETDIDGIGNLKLTDGFFQVYTPSIKGYTLLFSNRDMN